MEPAKKIIPMHVVGAGIDSLIPADIEAERMALGAALIDPEAAHLVSRLSKEHFYYKKNSIVFRAIKKLSLLGESLDQIVVVDCLKKHKANFEGCSDYIGELIDHCLTPQTVARHCQIIEDRYAERRALVIANEIIQCVRDNKGRKTWHVIENKVNEQKPENAAVVTAIEQAYEDFEAEYKGERMNIPFIGCTAMSKVNALIPGAISFLCGSPGASKSMFVTQQLWQWHDSGVSVAALMLEDNFSFHARRALAQKAKYQALTIPNAVKDNDTAKQLFETHKEWIEDLHYSGVIQGREKGVLTDRSYLIRWIAKNAKNNRVLVIDPYSRMIAKMRQDIEDQMFLDTAEEICIKEGCSLLCVTHPRDNPPGVNLVPKTSNMKGGKCIERFAKSIFWLEYHDEKSSEVITPMGRKFLNHNRTIWPLKIRTGAPRGNIAFNFDKDTLMHHELGTIDE